MHLEVFGLSNMVSRPSFLLSVPPGITFCNTESPPGLQTVPFGLEANLHLITSMKRVNVLDMISKRADVSERKAGKLTSAHLSRALSMLFRELYAAVALKLRRMAPCSVLGLDTLVQLPSAHSHFVQVTAIGMAVKEARLREEHERGESAAGFEDNGRRRPKLGPTLSLLSPPLREEESTGALVSPSASPVPSIGRKDSSPHAGPTGQGAPEPLSVTLDPAIALTATSPQPQLKLITPVVELTPLSYIPGARSVLPTFVLLGGSSTVCTRVCVFRRGLKIIEFLSSSCAGPALSHSVRQFLGRVNLHLIKESWSVKEGGGSSQIFHHFLTEANAMARAHVAGVGGNALLFYRARPEVSSASSGKGHVYWMLTISGDAVRVAR